MSTNTTNPPAPKAADQSAAPSGYQRTEVGIIPADWDVKTLNGLGSFIKGKGIKRDDVTEDGVACIRYGELYTRYNNYVYSAASRIPESVAQTSQPLKTGDLLFAGSGETAEEIGKCVAYLGEEEAYAGGDIVILRPVDQNSLYLGHLLNHAVVAEQKARYGQGDAVVHISARNLAMVKLPLPPTTDEQDAIAETLSAVDGLIGSLEKLIAKKRAIKQAAMQQLLTGKTRLPGFTGEWETKRLSEMLAYERPDKYIVTSTDYAATGDVPVLTANKGFILGYTYETQGICHNLPVIVFDDFTTDCKYADFPFKVKSSAIKLLRPISDRVDLRYMFGRMQLIRFPIGEHKRYYISEYQNIELPMPDDDEQHAIATVLSDMDREIESLEQRFDKTQKIKQGMMQQLLTGRVRLVNGEATA